MALTIDTTPAGATANSYATIAEADAYFEANAAFWTLWSAMTEAEKTARLIRAAQALDRYRFSGGKTTDAQALEFPRDGEVAVPERVKRGQLEMVLLHYAQSDTVTGAAKGAGEDREIGALRIPGVIDIHYSDAPIARPDTVALGASPESVRAALSPWLLSGTFAWER